MLPGVTVEARSPALIEQTRTAVSDANGRYRIEELRPGTYSVTFSLPGFSTFVREGIVLESEFTATINAQLQGRRPRGDGHGLRRVAGRRRAEHDEPHGALEGTDGSAAVGPKLPEPGRHDSRARLGDSPGGSTSAARRRCGREPSWRMVLSPGDMALEIDGMNVASILSTGQISGIYHNQSAYEEMSYQVVAGSAESQTGGVRINMIPKQGGNRFTWDAVVTYSNENLQSENNDAELRAKGLVVPPNLYRLRDYNFSIGGPIKRDRVWFFFSPRVWGAQQLHPEPVSSRTGRRPGTNRSSSRTRPASRRS